MFSNNWFFQKNGAERTAYSHNSISHSTNYSGLSNHKTAPKGMETALIIKIATWLGITSYVGAIILNAGTWKADVLWVLAVMFGIVKLFRYAMKTWQDYRKGEIEIKAEQKKIK